MNVAPPTLLTPPGLRRHRVNPDAARALFAPDSRGATGPGRNKISRGLAETEEMHDLAIIIVSTNESHWIRALLPTVFAHLGDIDADVVVVDNDSNDGVAEIVAT